MTRELTVLNLSEIPHDVRSTREDKVAAAGAWLAYADRDDGLERVAALAKVSAATVLEWMQEPWWGVAVEVARVRQGERIDARLTEVIRRSTRDVLDRIENGDEVMGRHGPVRVAVRAKDLMVIAALALDKRQIVRGQPTSISRSEGELGSLARKLKEVGMRGPPVALDASEGDKVVDLDERRGRGRG